MLQRSILLRRAWLKNGEQRHPVELHFVDYDEVLLLSWASSTDELYSLNIGAREPKQRTVSAISSSWLP